MERELEEFVAQLGFELVQLQRGGGRKRPLLRLRVDHAADGTRAGEAVTVEDCARVNRGVMQFLEERKQAQDFSLEVSSPGVERPLVRPRDFARFAGSDVRVQGYEALREGAKQIEGELLGLAPGEGEPRALIRVQDERLEIPLAGMARATLVYRLSDDL